MFEISQNEMQKLKSMCDPMLQEYLKQTRVTVEENYLESNMVPPLKSPSI